jgi:hypothetical protein
MFGQNKATIVHQAIMRLYVLFMPVFFLLSAAWAETVYAETWIDGSKARLQALDKITARISTVEAPVGASRFFGTLEVLVNRCAFHPPEEPPENVAFITIHDRGYNGLKPKMIFSGWVFSSSPAVSALEHPVYDLTLLACVDD